VSLVRLEPRMSRPQYQAHVRRGLVMASCSLQVSNFVSVFVTGKPIRAVSTIAVKRKLRYYLTLLISCRPTVKYYTASDEGSSAVIS
jgi:hypothetical protein